MKRGFRLLAVSVSEAATAEEFLFLRNKPLLEGLDGVVARFAKLKEQLETRTGHGEEVVRLMKQQTELEEVTGLITTLRQLEKTLEECEQIGRDAEQEEEMVRMAEEEKNSTLREIAEVEEALVQRILPPDKEENTTEVVLEVRAGTGGSEAQLFAQEVFEMYRHHCVEVRGWKFRVVNVTSAEGGGYRDASAIVTGEGTYAELRLEGGVHRVQRKPVTDKTRVHTSTTTVAVLPTAQDVVIDIPETDLIIETTRSRGAGGQHVNTTDSAIRVTHIPTGVVVSIQDDRSQHRNRAQAMDIIRAKVFAIKKAEVDKERADWRRAMIGSGDRSERIRTYNFPQDRITDHRIGFSVTGIDEMMRGELLAEFGERLRQSYLRERLFSHFAEKT